MFKKFFGTLLAFVFLVSLSPQTLAHEYLDVPRDSEFFYAIDYLRRDGVLMDWRYFYPESSISKANFIKYLVLLNSPDFRPQAPANLPFLDTEDTAWYASYFKEAIKLGILDQRDAYVFPYKKLTLVDALTLLFHSQSIPIPNVFKGSIPYTDISVNSPHAALLMRSAALGIVQPKSETYFGAFRQVNHAEAAMLIYQLELATLGADVLNSLPGVDKGPDMDPELEKILQVWELIETSFFYGDEIDKTKLSDAALESMIEALGDDYSVYYDAKGTQNFADSLDGSLEGIGAVLGTTDEGEIKILSTIEGAPAEAAGLLSGDIIVEVDDVSLAGQSIQDAVDLIKGPSGTTAHLKIRRNGQILDFNIKRAVVVVKMLSREILENGSIYHFTLRQFGSQAAAEFNTALVEFKNDPKAKGIILDLRDNPGGFLSAAVEILGHFVPAQEVVVRVGYKDYYQELLSPGPTDLEDIPLVVLINSSSASASEVVAGALKDYDLATLIGETSFGKGTVQSVHNFGDASSVKLTVAQWRTPQNNIINEEGVDPDVEIFDNPDTATDEQLQRAITEIKKAF